jgi:hypothetical protein
MAWFRHHFSCQACDGSWLIEAEIVEVANCPFCAARDVFPYRSEDWTVSAAAARTSRRSLASPRSRSTPRAAAAQRRQRKAAG